MTVSVRSEPRTALSAKIIIPGGFGVGKTTFAVGINQFPGSARFEPDEIREALGVPARIPLVPCDARDRESVKTVVVAPLDTVIATA